MHDRPTRRQALAGLGAVSLGGLLAACGPGGERAPAAPRPTPAEFDRSATCEVATELTEGPFYLDVDAIRSDLREDREGTVLRLGVRVRDAGSCEPLEGAVVDVWHCDATGAYSGVEGDEATYLRGAQATNADGIAEFRTIYPGRYPGRTTHIHAKVHLDRRTLLTTQFFTTQAMDDVVFARAPYADAQGAGATNETDGIFSERGVLTLSRDGDDVVGLITVDVRRA